MSRKEALRPGLVKALVAGQFTNRQVAGGLHLSIRQVQRLKRRFRTAGVAGLVHRTRGGPPPRWPRRCGSGRRADAHGYAGLNDCHLTEKLRRPRPAFGRSRSAGSARAWGCPPSTPGAPPRHRRRRLPEARAGSLVLLDGSPAAWLEDPRPGPDAARRPRRCQRRGPRPPLPPRRGSARLRHVLATVFPTGGLPVACYGDGTNILVRNDPHWSLDEELRGAQDPTHLGRVLRDLGIGYIRARSPQAKGRIERLWRTLPGSAHRRAPAAGDHHARGRHRLPAPLHRRLQSPLRAPARRSHARLAPPAARSPARPELSLHADRGPGQHRPPRPALAATAASAPGGRSHAGRRLELRECLDGRLVALDAGRLLAAQPAPGPDFVLRPRSDPTPNAAIADASPGARPMTGAAISPFPPTGLPRPSRRAPARPRRAAALTLRIRGAADSTPSA